MQRSPSADQLRAVASAMGEPVASWSVVKGGRTNSVRFIAYFEGRSSVFVKIATDGQTNAWLRREGLVYTEVHSRVLPKLLAFDPRDLETLMILEDLSWCGWPPPWTEDNTRLVLEGFATLRSASCSALPKLSPDDSLLAGWEEVAANPGLLLRTGCCNQRWLDRYLPTLRDAADPDLMASGEHLIHLDVRSDNVALCDDRAIFVDWGWAARGNPDLDLAFWLPSLEMEGGPQPEDVSDLPSSYAVAVAGLFATRAGLPDIPGAPEVRSIQRDQLRISLSWVARKLALPDPSRDLRDEASL